MSDTQDAPIVDAHVETEARDYGWAPKEQFKGPVDKWKPADEYLGWAKQVGRLPKSEFDAIKSQFPAIRQENQALKGELTEIKTTLNQFVEFSSKAEERAYNKARRELEARIETAATNADPVAARAAMAELEQLKPEPKVEPKKVEAQTVAADPVIQDWISKEEWFTKSRALNAFATDEFGELERSKPGMPKADILAEVKRRTMEKFPEKFGINPARDNPVTVASPSGQMRTPKRGKTYDDLPADAKVACDKFVKQIPGYTREQYVKQYDWD
jgi:hypothetical protein